MTLKENFREIKEEYGFCKFRSQGLEVVDAVDSNGDHVVQSGYDGDSRGNLLDQARTRISESKGRVTSVRIIFFNGVDYKTLAVRGKTTG